MFPLYCLLFLGFLCSLQTISADRDTQAPNGYTPVSPINQNILASFDVLKPLIVQYLYEHYPEYASGTIQSPLSASQQLVSHSAHYRVSFSILAPNSDSKLSTGNFTALIEKQTNHDANSINFVLIQVTFENEKLDLASTSQPKLGSQEDKNENPGLLFLNDPSSAVYAVRRKDVEPLKEPIDDDEDDLGILLNEDPSSVVYTARPKTDRTTKKPIDDDDDDIGLPLNQDASRAVFMARPKKEEPRAKHIDDEDDDEGIVMFPDPSNDIYLGPTKHPHPEPIDDEDLIRLI